MTRSALMLAWCCSVALTGCASNLAVMQTARTLNPGDVRLSTGFGYSIPVTQGLKVIGEGVDVAKTGIEAAAKGDKFQLSEEQKKSLAASAVSIAIMPPSAGYQMDMRVGIFNNLDVGLRYSINAVKADAKLRLFHSGDADSESDGPGRKSKDIALGFGVTKYIYPTSYDAFGAMKLDDFSRWDFEVPLYVSIDVSRYFGVYGAARYIYSRTNFDQHYKVQSASCCSDQPTVTDTVTKSRVDMHFGGGTMGMRVGNHRFSWMLELTIGVTRARTLLLGDIVDLGGLTIYPATGFALTF